MESPRLPVTIVGAGISGVACARVLTAAGIPVELVDRGRRVGGRMASRRHEGRPVDIGASYVTVSDPGFEEVVARWADAGLAQEWTDTFGVASGVDEGRTTTSGPTRRRDMTCRDGRCAWWSPTTTPTCATI